MSELTLEQVARAFNVLCQRWWRRRHGRGDLDQVAHVVQYHQRRNAAARRSRLRRSPGSG